MHDLHPLMPSCQIFECVRKLAVACVPVFFQPSGSASQLTFGLMVCFVAFGAYVHFDPYEDRGNDAVAKLCQMQIFFSLLASVALSSISSEQEAGSNMDVLLVVLYLVPVRPPCNSREARSPLTLGFVIGAGRACGLPREPATHGGQEAARPVEAAAREYQSQLSQDGQGGVQGECCAGSQGARRCLEEGVEGHVLRPHKGAATS